MNMRQLETTLAATDPLGQGLPDGIDLEAMEAELLADLEGEQPAPSPLGTETPPGRRPRRLVLALGTAALAAAVAAAVVLVGGTSQQPSRAYGAELVRLAESSPLLLLEGPGWRVQDVYQWNGGGTMKFVTGKPVPDEAIFIHADGTASGMLPAAVRQRRVELSWRRGSIAEALAAARRVPHPHGRRWVRAPVLGTSAHVDTRAEAFPNQGGPGDRQMVALWPEGDYLMEMRAAVPDLAAFEERLGWLRSVDSRTWLDAMPPTVVKAADHDATVRRMLRGIPLPPGFDPGLIPDEGLTTDRGAVAGTVVGTVSCLWFRRWGDARRTGDRAERAEAERAMTSAPRWPVVRQMKRQGGYPELLSQLVKSMPTGVWQFGPHRWRVLPKAEGLGCAHWGIPVLPWKQERQAERQPTQPRS